eukprot:TRINITY_DN17348_c0_g1_i1.p3 TRINITY_DN17348_c0_g1~~TRINITY_DN17348_c0_g1_i1.p3  ORF type:complete len:101 (+),score=12.98 TRINITY_DN17348_c0_g1_i1:73-375(+)
MSGRGAERTCASSGSEVAHALIARYIHKQPIPVPDRRERLDVYTPPRRGEPEAGGKVGGGEPPRARGRHPVAFTSPVRASRYEQLKAEEARLTAALNRLG